MNDLAPIRRKLPPPTLAEPIPTLVGKPGLTLLQSATASALARVVSREDATVLTATCQAVLDSCTPAQPLEVGAVLEGLALHYPVLRRTDGENRIVASQWVDDLEGYPLDLIVEGARLWRNSPKDRFPTAGQFKALIEPIFTLRNALAVRAEGYLMLTEDTRP